MYISIYVYSVYVFIHTHIYYFRLKLYKGGMSLNLLFNQPTDLSDDVSSPEDLQEDRPRVFFLRNVPPTDPSDEQVSIQNRINVEGETIKKK